MTREDLIQYAYETYGTQIEYLWKSSPDNGILRHKHNRKWYAAILPVAGNKVGLDSDEIIDILDLKCEPDMIYSLCEQRGFAPAYHMNKKHWITIILDGTVSKDVIYNLLDLSYEMTK